MDETGPAGPATAADGTRASGGTPLLAVDGLVVRYGRIEALHGVRLEVRSGELVALVGANGAGKTTLLRAISGVLPAAAGQLRFDGADITRLAPERRVRRGICQVPEGRQVFAALSVQDNLRLGAYARVDRAHRDEDLERMYAAFPVLRQKAGLAAGTLSGGQQQMLALARALMGRPRLLLLDEPSMGLAPVMVEQVFEAIVALRQQAMTILLVEQNAAAALAIADRGYVLETGSVALGGTGADLLGRADVQQVYLGM